MANFPKFARLGVIASGVAAVAGFVIGAQIDPEATGRMTGSIIDAILPTPEEVGNFLATLFLDGMFAATAKFFGFDAPFLRWLDPNVLRVAPMELLLFAVTQIG